MTEPDSFSGTPRPAAASLPAGREHEHLHLFADGLRAFVHEHPRPVSEADHLATRPHRHLNGSHSHPHGHGDYRPLPAGEERRPIIPQGGLSA